MKGMTTMRCEICKDEFQDQKTAISHIQREHGKTRQDAQNAIKALNDMELAAPEAIAFFVKAMGKNGDLMETLLAHPHHIST